MFLKNIILLSDTFLKKAKGKLILVIDDDPARHKLFSKQLDDQNTVYHVYNYDQAVKALDKYSPFDVIYWDHDLGDFGESPHGYGGTVERTGADIASYLVNMLPKDKYPKLSVIHSWNYSGAQNIASTLSKAGIPIRREPFGDSLGSTDQVWIKEKEGAGKWILWEGVEPSDPIVEKQRKGGTITKIVPFGEDPNDE